MSKNKKRQNRGGGKPPKQGKTPKGTGKLVKVPASPPAGPPQPVREEIDELDWLRWRVAQQKEQGLMARKEKLETEQKSIRLEQDNLNLRIQLLRHENTREIGHLNLGPKDRVMVEDERYWIVRPPGSPLKALAIKQLPAPTEKPKKLEVVKDEPPENEGEQEPEGDSEGEPEGEPKEDPEGEDGEPEGDEGQDGDEENEDGETEEPPSE